MGGYLYELNFQLRVFCTSKSTGITITGRYLRTNLVQKLGLETKNFDICPL